MAQEAPGHDLRPASITFHAVRTGVEVSSVSTGCAMFGVLVIAMCMVARRRLAGYLRIHAIGA